MNIKELKVIPPKINANYSRRLTDIYITLGLAVILIVIGAPSTSLNPSDPPISTEKYFCSCECTNPTGLEGCSEPSTFEVSEEDSCEDSSGGTCCNDPLFGTATGTWTCHEAQEPPAGTCDCSCSGSEAYCESIAHPDIYGSQTCEAISASWGSCCVNDDNESIGDWSCTDVPTPTPTETPTPSPTETPTETPSPSPTETPTPSPSEPPTPDPSPDFPGYPES